MIGWLRQIQLTVDQICNLLAFVLNNSFFVFKGAHYHEIFGCTMGSPVSAVLAELVMQRVERIATRSSPVSVKWWKRYVDDSNACLKQDYVETFHNHLNSINKYIQFTIEKPTVNADSQTIAFLDTEINTKSGNITVKVFRKGSHTDKYLNFHSHNPVNDKKAVIKTLFERAKSIPSTTQLQKSEIGKVFEVLELNGYKRTFIDKTITDDTATRHNTEFEFRGSTCLPYVKGVSDRVKNILTGVGIRVAFKPVLTVANIFGKPKMKHSDDRMKAIVYKFKCRSCSFTYIGESKRCWCSRWLEHKPGVRRENFSATKEHAESTGHDAQKSDTVILEKGIKNYDQRIFLEALHSKLNADTVNEHALFPTCYLPLLDSIKRNHRHYKDDSI